MPLKEHDFDEFSELASKLTGEESDSESGVALEDIFPDSFMGENTDFPSISGFFSSSPWDVETGRDFEGIPSEEFDEYVDEHTEFSNWEEMLSSAASEWARGEAENEQ